YTAIARRSETLGQRDFQSPRNLSARPGIVGHGVMVLDPNLDPMGAALAPTGHHRTKQALAVLSENPHRNTLSDTADDKAFRFFQPVTMKTPAASAIVTIFNRINQGQMPRGPAPAVDGPPVRGACGSAGGSSPRCVPPLSEGA